MPSCAVVTCRLRSQVSNMNNSGISFHRFPKEEILRAKWIDVTGRVDWSPKRLSTICSIHFTDGDFEIKQFSGNRYLKAGAVPSVRVACCYTDDKSPKYKAWSKETKKRSKTPSNINESKVRDNNKRNHKNYMQVIIDRKSSRSSKSTPKGNRWYETMVHQPHSN